MTLSPEKQEILKQLKTKGFYNKDIANLLKCNKDTVKNYNIRFNLSKRRNRYYNYIPDYIKVKTRELLVNGENLDDIRKQTKLSHSSIGIIRRNLSDKELKIREVLLKERNYPAEKEYNIMQDFYNCKLSLTKIRKKYKIGISKLNRVLEENNVTKELRQERIKRYWSNKKWKI